MNARSTVRRLLGFALQDRALLAGAIVLLLIATAADVAGPYLIKIFIDDYVQPGHYPMASLAWLLGAYVALQVIAASANFAQSVRFNRIAVDAVQTLREQVFAHMLKLPVRYFDRTPTGSLISRITNDSESIKDLYVNVLGTYIQNTTRIIGIFVAMALLDTKLMAICLVLVPLIIGLMVVYRRKSTPRFQRARALLSEINSRLHESIQGMSVIQLFNQQQRFHQSFCDSAQAHYRAKLSNLKLDAMLLRPMIDVMHMVTLALLLWVFGVESLGQAVEVGVIYAFVTYLSRFTEPVIEMVHRLSLFQQAVVSGQRVFELLDTPVETQRDAMAARIGRGAVAFDHVSFSYDGEHDVLHDVSFAIPAGQCYAMVGHTCSGKSTLASLLLRFYAPRTGEVRIDDVPVAQFSKDEFHARVGIVQQDPYVFSGSIADNIAFGRTLDASAIEHAAEQAGLHEFVQSLPEGYATVLKERGSNLSTGQRQLIALARTLALQPKILLLDEATAHVDSETEAVVQHALRVLRGKVTMFVIAHRLSTIRDADRILVLHQGCVVQEGRHEELLARDGLYRHLHELQQLQQELV